MNSEILYGILAVVSSVSEISMDDIVSPCKRSDVVDARCIFVYFAVCKFGIKAHTIAKFLNRQRVCSVNDCIRNHNNFSEQSFSYRLMCKNVAEKLAEIYPESQR